VDYVDVPLRVRYAETDMMGIVYYGSYPAYLEVARSEFMREKGFPYKKVEEMGFSLVVAGMEVRYLNPAHYDDVLSIRTKVSEIQSRGVTFDYAIFRGDTAIVEAKTKHICVSTDRRTRRLPPFLVEILKNGSST
jgi:acyl-CoA thioester hydrolase